VILFLLQSIDSHQPVLAGVHLLQILELNVLATDLHIANTIEPRRLTWIETNFTETIVAKLKEVNVI
jgi:hypothetical protein